MSEKYEIVRNVTADGKPFEAGQVVSREDVPASCFDSMLRVGHMKPLDSAPVASPEPAKNETGGDQPDQPEKKKKKRGRPRKVKPEGEQSDQPEPAESNDPEPAGGDQPEPEQPENETPEIPAGI